MTPATDKAAAVNAVRIQIAAGMPEAAACRVAGVDRATYRRWAEHLDTGGVEALHDGVGTGRRPLVTLTPDEATALRKRFVVSNRSDLAGSMTYAARSLAKDPSSVLTPATRAAILKPRSSKHLLPVEVRRAMRGASAAIQGYRSPDRARLGGVHASGCLRMVREVDGTLRRLIPGERQSWDDASINFVTHVPWPWGGDACSDRWGVRVGRFQLLAGIDDATDDIVAYSFVIRDRDAYRAEDVCAAIHRAWLATYTPASVMFEGGAWQAQRTLEYLQRAGVALCNAKGRPHNKLIEGVWNRLWTPLSVESKGQIGRYRGEMERETALWMKCQAGSLDPRSVFPGLEESLASIARAVDYTNHEIVQSAEYGRWVPAEAHAAGLAAHPRAPAAASLGWLAWPERHKRVVLPGGQVKAAALSPLGHMRVYHFADDVLVNYPGAPVWLTFDPYADTVTAVVALRDAWRDLPAGKILAARALSVGNDAHVIRDESAWRVVWGDGVANAQRARRNAAAAVRREHVALGLDGRRVRTIVRELRAAGGAVQQNAIAPMADPLVESVAAAAATPNTTDFEALERAAGVLVRAS